ncbi:hypothetical protein E2C01_009454 [Portunus trituberculatus]|uniref:Secreted protein n=1 Tax=Portunus trituberculatus TaxID=210409 RepID=A0A5B7D5T8_PORTR|nr:hypothetical protein [Portunus trituberculatus]
MVHLLVSLEQPVAALLSLWAGGSGGGPDDGGGEAILTLALALLQRLGVPLHLVGRATLHTHTGWCCRCCCHPHEAAAAVWSSVLAAAAALRY